MKDDLQLGKLKENCLLLKLYCKLRKSPRRESNPQPSDVINLVQNLYDNYTISIGTKTFTTNPIRVEKGVLQGDCLSLPLFNVYKYSYKMHRRRTC